MIIAATPAALCQRIVWVLNRIGINRTGLFQARERRAGDLAAHSSEAPSSAPSAASAS